jgi:cation transport protein ChaC
MQSTKKQMSLTPDLVALSKRDETEGSDPPGLTPIKDGERRAFIERLLSECDGHPLWVFAYGSLIWRPVFDPLERRRAAAPGWHRSFCLEMPFWRGTPERPGLMMALDHGGRCEGVALRSADHHKAETIGRLVSREIEYVEDLRSVRWINVGAPVGGLRALVFYAGPKGPGVSRKLPLELVAKRLAAACGTAGSCAEYLYHTVAHLEELGIRDRNLWRLQEMVAKELRDLHLRAK